MNQTNKYEPKGLYYSRDYIRYYEGSYGYNYIYGITFKNRSHYTTIHKPMQKVLLLKTSNDVLEFIRKYATNLKEYSKQFNIDFMSSPAKVHKTIKAYRDDYWKRVELYEHLHKAFRKKLKKKYKMKNYWNTPEYIQELQDYEKTISYTNYKDYYTVDIKIDFKKVAKDFAGIEFRDNSSYMIGYYSRKGYGCIWNTDIITIELMSV